MNIPSSLVITAILLGLLQAPSGHAALQVRPSGVLQYDNETEFTTAFPGLTLEDFEESPVPAGGSTECAGPIDSTTDQAGCFAPGDIAAGLTIDSLPDNRVPVAGAGYSTLTTSSVTLSSTPVLALIHISFTGTDIRAVGMDLASFTTGTTYTIKLYDSSDALIDTFTVTGVPTSETFFGIYSPTPIKTVTLDNGENEVVDNIRFGAPAGTLTWYTSAPAFHTSHRGLPRENFEEGIVSDNAIFAQPLDTTTDNGFFSPGDIAPGLEITTVSTATPSTALWSFAGGVSNNSSINVGTTNVNDDLQLNFSSPDTVAVGMDLLLEFGGGTAVVIVYGSSDTVLGTATLTQGNPPAETFFGVAADQTITRIEIISSANEFVDNIFFGTGSPFPWNLFLPAITGRQPR
ncbi:MAG: hypothetical protein Kow0089_12510 [Desulfobulbaceae bacterium]